MTLPSPDMDDRNADWSKRTWDLPKTLAGFMAFLAGQAVHNERSIEDEYRAFQDRPSSNAMPKELRAEVESALFGGLPVTMVDTQPRQVVIDSASGSD